MARAANWLDGSAPGRRVDRAVRAELADAPPRCQSYGATRAVGAHRLHLRVRSVLRCPSCDAVGLVLTTLPDPHVVCLGGTWQVPRADLSEKADDAGHAGRFTQARYAMCIMPASGPIATRRAGGLLVA
jgi:hypothetical protein